MNDAQHLNGATIRTAITVRRESALWRALLTAGWAPSEKIREHQIMVSPGGEPWSMLYQAGNEPLWPGEDEPAELQAARALRSTADGIIAALKGLL